MLIAKIIILRALVSNITEAISLLVTNVKGLCENH